ncbi:MAG: hypothetical protein LR015_04090 [Verrucomicrobia bacterium]|nr:hypothetical protein [Verrucomicrobiota bacterium]
MEPVAVIATIILVATLLTLVFSFMAYVITRAKKLLPQRRAAAPLAEGESVTTRIYFQRYLPGNATKVGATVNKAPEGDQWM